MKYLVLFVVGVTSLLAVRRTCSKEVDHVAWHPRLSSFIQARLTEFGEIPVERKSQLRKVTDYVKSRRAVGLPTSLNFICTHNSRRSQMSQLWAAAAAAYFNIDDVATFSGGTESTAFNPRAVSALERAGFEVKKLSDEPNPKYQVSFADGVTAAICFSKVYDAEPNPTKDFCAVMTCAEADKKCPVVDGASLRLAIPFEDPKIADNTPQEAGQYDERCAQIAREMLFIFSEVSNGGRTQTGL